VPPAERDADEALAAGFIVGGANGVAPPMENNRRSACGGWALSSFQKRAVRSLIYSYGRIYFRATGISPHCRESIPRDIKELAIIDTSHLARSSA
jgi:hypothetical protein